METSDRKIVISGDRVEFYSYQHFYDYGKRGKKIDQQAGISAEKVKDLYQSEKERRERREKFRLANRIRSKTNLVRLVNANKTFDRGRHSFLTLTYKKNQKNITEAQRDFAKFVQRVNYALFTGKKSEKLRYVAVIEFQDKKRNGVIHFHVILFDVPYIHWNTLTNLWGHGSIDIRARDKRGKAMTVTRVARYMGKYMAKGFEDKRLNGKKKYFSSRGVYRPLVIREPNHVDSFRPYLHDPLRTKTLQYHSRFLGTCFYFVYEGVSMEELQLLIEDIPPPRYKDNEKW